MYFVKHYIGAELYDMSGQLTIIQLAFKLDNL